MNIWGGNKVMKRNKYILKEASVITIGMLLICTCVAGIATTNIDDKVSLKCETPNTPQNIFPCQLSEAIPLWDNFVLTWKVGYHSQNDPEQFDSYVADDFLFETETEVNWVYWQIWYGWVPPRDYHYNYSITFFEDDGTGTSPGAIYKGPYAIADEDIDKSRPYVNLSFPDNTWICGATSLLPEPVVFNADTKYWITIYSVGPISPYTYFSLHNESQGGIRLHEAKVRSDHWGYPNWTSLSEITVDNEQLDANFILGGGDPPFEVSIKKGLGATITITNNLPEGEIGLVNNMTVNITATGDIILNPIKNVLIPEFEGQTTETIKYYPIGIGNIAIKVYCTSDELGIGDTETTGLLLIVFLL
jgi:hypothetical protein